MWPSDRSRRCARKNLRREMEHERKMKEMEMEKARIELEKAKVTKSA